MEEALAVQEAARRAMAGKTTQSDVAHASAEVPHRQEEAPRHDEHAEADAAPEQREEQPAAAPAADEPERPHVGLAEVTELPEVSCAPRAPAAVANAQRLHHRVIDLRRRRGPSLVAPAINDVWLAPSHSSRLVGSSVTFWC